MGCADPDCTAISQIEANAAKTGAVRAVRQNKANPVAVIAAGQNEAVSGWRFAVGITLEFSPGWRRAGPK
jgi:hypothetical protein